MMSQPATAPLPQSPANENPTTNGHPNSPPHAPTEAKTNGQASSPPLAPTRKAPAKGGRRLFLRVLTLGALLGGIVGLLMLIGTATGMIRPFGRSNRADLILHRVQYERLQVTITERGQLESAENKDVVCRVKARSANSTVATTIRWVIDDGTHVKRGDKLVQLDDSGLYEQLKLQKIVVDQAYAAWITAEKNYEIVASQNSSDIATAKLALELAEIDLNKYVEGEYKQAEQEIQGRLMIARSDLAMWEERAAWSGRMSRPGRMYVTVAQAQADEAKLKSARIALSKVEQELHVLQKFMGPRTKKDFQGKVDEAKRAIDRVNAQAKAKEVQADADRKSKQSVYEQEAYRQADIEEEIRKCQIVAPQDGLVVYNIEERSRWGSGSQQSIIAQGEPVREGQKLMRIPDLSKMVVNTRVHEAMISRVRGEKWKKTGFSEGVQSGLLFLQGPFVRLSGQKFFSAFREDFIDEYKDVEMRKLADGQPAQVRVDAFPERTLAGEVKSVATVASQQDFLSADVKVYQTLIEIKDSQPGLKPGMSAEVTIFTDDARGHCLAVPVQAILGNVGMGNKRRVYVMTEDGPEAREVVVGLSNDRMAEIVSGLEEGDQVVVNPRVLLSEKEKAQFGDTGGYTYRATAEGKGSKGKGGKGKTGKGGASGKDKWPKQENPGAKPGPSAPGGLPPSGR